MTANEIVEKVKALNWSKGSYVVFGSCPLALAELRESDDIDCLVSEELFAKLPSNGWELRIKDASDYPVVLDDFEAFKTWSVGSYQTTLEQLLATATILDGIAFASLEEVRKWKTASGRPKDLNDIKLIDIHLAK